MRGNRRPTVPAATPTRSIPACAGEPISANRTLVEAKVYPRVCGGTAAGRLQFSGGQGLSPRVRGNLRRRGRHGSSHRSIPACAGEPRSFAGGPCEWRVYPRVCGGTTGLAASICESSGLSPRVRGNHGSSAAPGTPAGSIPACAGEPVYVGKAFTPTGVYPRVCGGTQPSNRNGPGRTGLSPRVRGNLVRLAVGVGRVGSIPACAGEPIMLSFSLDEGEVYPRVCGGTQVGHGDIRAVGGLSPRVRGNPMSMSAATGIRWSIPACAGEPREAACPAG